MLYKGPVFQRFLPNHKRLNILLTDLGLWQCFVSSSFVDRIFWCNSNSENESFRDFAYPRGKARYSRGTAGVLYTSSNVSNNSKQTSLRTDFVQLHLCFHSVRIITTFHFICSSQCGPKQCPFLITEMEQSRAMQEKCGKTETVVCCRVYSVIQD